MSSPSLQVGGMAWRAAQVAGWLGASLDHAPGDDVIDGLRETGEPPGGWWELLARLRAEPHAVTLALPRPGDLRGVPVPRDLDAHGAVGCRPVRPDSGEQGIWLLAGPAATWTLLPQDGPVSAHLDLGDADRGLRRALVESAQALDGSDPNPFGAGAPATIDRTVDAWLDSVVPVDATARALAARGLRLLMAIDAWLSLHHHAGVTLAAESRIRSALAGLEPAARTAVEAAYSRDANAG